MHINVNNGPIFLLMVCDSNLLNLHHSQCVEMKLVLGVFLRKDTHTYSLKLVYFTSHSQYVKMKPILGIKIFIRIIVHY